MSTFRRFNDMLNEHLDYKLLMDEIEKRNYLIQKVDKDQNWKGGNLVVPFKGGKASSIKFGGLTAEADIGENTYVRGNVADYKEVWGTLKFNSRDLKEHTASKGQSGSAISESSFLQGFTDQIEEFMDDMQQTTSVNMLTGQHFAQLTADSVLNDGVITVDRVERFTIDQKVVVDDDDSAPITAYVRLIDINANQVELWTARTAGVVVNFAAVNMTVAQNAKVYHDGADTASNSFTSLRDQLLSLANGGSANLFGQSKLSFPYLQSTNIDGSGILASSLLDSIFDAWTRTKQLGRGRETEVLMSYKHLGTIMKQLESGAGAYRHVSTTANTYGYTRDG